MQINITVMPIQAGSRIGSRTLVILIGKAFGPMKIATSQKL